MFKIGGREFKDEGELTKFLVGLVEVGEGKMREGSISTLCYEEVVTHWNDLVERAVEDGVVSESARTAMMDVLYKHVGEPYPEEALQKTLKERRAERSTGGREA